MRKPIKKGNHTYLNEKVFPGILFLEDEEIWCMIWEVKSFLFLPFGVLK